MNAWPLVYVSYSCTVLRAQVIWSTMNTGQLAQAQTQSQHPFPLDSPYLSIPVADHHTFTLISDMHTHCMASKYLSWYFVVCRSPRPHFQTWDLSLRAWESVATRKITSNYINRDFRGKKVFITWQIQISMHKLRKARNTFPLFHFNQERQPPQAWMPL